MNDQTKQYIVKLKDNPNVLGIILFGSWARGNQREDSDVDLVVILKEGYQRAVEEFDGQIFEIIYITADGAYNFWETHLDDAYFLWDVAKVIYDQDEVVDKLQDKTEKLLAKGKQKISTEQIPQMRFDAEDQLKVSNLLIEKDPTTAMMILNSKVYDLSGIYFDLRGLWTVPPKQRLDKLKEINLNLYNVLTKFYSVETDIQEKIELANKIIGIVFKV